MSTLNPTLDIPEVAIPFRVRLDPYLVESICELARLLRDKGSRHSDISGLLFGRVEPGVRTAEALKTFVDTGAHSELARRERWERAYKATLEESKNDPELSAFAVVGWFSFRTGTGLLSSDIVFHNQYFRRPEDLALIVWREGPSQITAEVYSKADGDTLTSDDYRWGSVRLSADIRHMREPVELAMRVKLADDSYLRTYDNGETPSQMEHFKRMAGAVRDKLLGFLYNRRNQEDAYAERIRGFIGDGRLPSRPAISDGPVPSPAAYFNPYSTDAAMGRSRLAETGPQPAPPPADVSPASPAWPVSGGGAFAAAPARIPHLRPEPHLDPRFASYAPPPPPISHELAPMDRAHLEVAHTDLANIGRAPRTGRAEYPEVSGLPMVLRPPSYRKSFPWAWATGLFVLCSALVFAFLAVGSLQNDGGRLGQVVQAICPGGDLNLRVRNEDDRLRLSWNQRNHVVASASGATLQIFDGQQHREIQLDGPQVADGSVLYRPLTSDVTFRLEVRGEQGATTGSLRVLDGLSARQAVLDVSAPAVPAAPVQSAASATPSPLFPLPGDSAAPALIRNSPAAAPRASTDPNYPPPTGAHLASNSASLATGPAAESRQRVARYETPQTITPIQPSPIQSTSTGSTINGWDTGSSRSRSKRRPAPVYPAASSANTPSVNTKSVNTKSVNTGYVPPRPLMQVMPNTRAIPNGTIQGRTRLEVQVEVDQQGRVSSAHAVGTGVNEKISSAALAAARQWTFDPASINGQRVVSEHTIVFEFRPEQH
jgi:hypothetical protein